MNCRLTSRIGTLAGCFVLFISAICPAAGQDTRSPGEITTKGEGEVERLLKDRPALKAILVQDDSLWGLLGTTFSGRLEWSSVRPAMPASLHTDLRVDPDDGSLLVYADNAPPGMAPVDAGELVLGWVMFELLHATHRDEIQVLRLKAEDGMVPRDEYINAMAEIYHAACLQEAEFYHRVWVPYATARSLPLISTDWHAEDAANFQDWCKTAFPKGDPAVLYGPEFDGLAGKGLVGAYPRREDGLAKPQAVISGIESSSGEDLQDGKVVSPDGLWLAAACRVADPAYVWQRGSDRFRVVIWPCEDGEASGGRYLGWTSRASLSVIKLTWSPDSKYLVLSTTSSGGHFPWHYPTFVFSVADRTLRAVDGVTGPVLSREVGFKGPHMAVFKAGKVEAATTREVDLGKAAARMEVVAKLEYSEAW